MPQFGITDPSRPLFFGPFIPADIPYPGGQPVEQVVTTPGPDRSPCRPGMPVCWLSVGAGVPAGRSTVGRIGRGWRRRGLRQEAVYDAEHYAPVLGRRGRNGRGRRWERRSGNSRWQYDRRHNASRRGGRLAWRELFGGRYGWAVVGQRRRRDVQRGERCREWVRRRGWWIFGRNGRSGW